MPSVLPYFLNDFPQTLHAQSSCPTPAAAALFHRSTAFHQKGISYADGDYPFLKLLDAWRSSHRNNLHDGASGRDDGRSGSGSDSDLFAGLGGDGSDSHRTVHAVTKQVGDSILIRDNLTGIGGNNWLVAFRLGTPGKHYFCDNFGSRKLKPLPEDRHPEVELAYPVKDLHVRVLDKGVKGELKESIVWDAFFARDQPTRLVSSADKPEGGAQKQWKPPCPEKNQLERLEVELSGHDPRPRRDPREPPDRQNPDRSFKEFVMYGVELKPLSGTLGKAAAEL